VIFIDVDECVENTHRCSAHADCEDTEGSYTCTCHEGYRGDGENCKGSYFLFIMHKILMIEILFFNTK